MDTGSTNGIFAWVGKEATKEERIQVMKSAEAFLEQNGLPRWTKVRNDDSPCKVIFLFHPHFRF